MSCLRFNQEIASACRNGQTGISKVWLANYDSLLTFTTDTTGVILSGITCTGETTGEKCFYTVAQNKQVAILLDTAAINIQNGTSTSKPKLTIKVVGLDENVLAMFNQLKQASVIAVVKALNEKYYAIGFNNGLDAIVATIGTEANADGFMGATYELEGIEPSVFYILGPDLTTSFESTYVV